MSQGHRVVCVLSDGMTSIGVAIANDLFGAPWESVLGVPWYSYRTCSAEGARLNCEGAWFTQVMPLA